MSSKQKIKLGIIGTGNIGRVHLTEFSKTDHVEIHAVTDTFIQSAKDAAQQYGVSKVHDSAEALIQDDAIDAVVVAVPNQYHAAIAVQALQAGKHVLIEKPMAINLEEAKQIVRAQRESGTIVMIAHQMRWESNAVLIKEQMDKGAFGRIYHAKTGWFRRKGIPGWGTWFTQRAQSGGGPLIDIGVHMIDLALYLMGNPKPVSVYGSTYAEFGPRKRGIGTWGTPDWQGKFDVEDLATALIKMEDGSSLSLDVSWAVHMETSNNPFIHLMGSEGGAFLDGHQAKIFTEMFDRTIDLDLPLTEDERGARGRLSDHFITSILNNEQPVADVMSGFTNNLILDAIYESSRTGREVTLDWTI